MNSLSTAFFLYLLANVVSGFYYAGKKEPKTFSITPREMITWSLVYLVIAVYLVTQ